MKAELVDRQDRSRGGRHPARQVIR